MPCYEPPYPEEVLSKKMPAVLCGLVKAVGVDKVVALVDWNEVGVPSTDFLEWWKMHQDRDASRNSG